MSQHFADSLRRLLADYRKPVERPLLDDIHREMARRGMPVPASSPGPVLNSKRWMSAAAVALLMAGGTMLWWQTADDSPAVAPTAVPSAGQIAQSTDQPTGSSLSRNTSTSSQGDDNNLVASARNLFGARSADKTEKSQASKVSRRLMEAERPIASETIPSTDIPASDLIASDLIASAEAPSAEIPSSEISATESASADTHSSATQTLETAEVVGEKARWTTMAVDDEWSWAADEASRWMAQAYIGSTGSSTTGSSADPIFNDMGYLTMASKAPMYRSAVPYANDEEAEMDHHQPLKLGLQVAYRLTDRWTVQTGVTYSRLSSDITTTDYGASTAYKQRLQFVGLPLQASYTVYQTPQRRSAKANRNQVRLYLTAGGEMQKMVSGQIKATDNSQSNTDQAEKTSLKMSPMQWSVMGGAGVEYLPTSEIGVYVEPSMTHYFDNHSDIRTYYNKHDWQFGLNLGLRWHLK